MILPLRPGSAAALKRTYRSAASAPSGSAGSAPLPRAVGDGGTTALPFAVAGRGAPRPSLMAACTCSDGHRLWSAYHASAAADNVCW